MHQQFRTGVGWPVDVAVPGEALLLTCFKSFSPHAATLPMSAVAGEDCNALFCQMRSN